MSDLEQARQRWTEARIAFQQFGDEVARRLRSALQNEGIWAEVTTRAKETESLIRKLITKGQHTYETLGDKCGVRVILRYKNDIELVMHQVTTLFACGIPENKADTLAPAEVGYLSTHIDIRLKPNDELAERFPPSDFQAELQVRTMAQHLWSEMSHDTIYKNDETLNPLPASFRRRVFILAGLIEVADDEFNRLSTEMPTIPEVSLLRSLERHYYKLTTRRGDSQVSLELIRLLFPLYGQEPRQIASHLDKFYTEHEAELRAVYEDSAQSPDRSAFLYQPEALMIYDLLESDASKTRRVWNEHYPERELERIANAFGISFD